MQNDDEMKLYDSSDFDKGEQTYVSNISCFYAIGRLFYMNIVKQPRKMAVFTILEGKTGIYLERIYSSKTCVRGKRLSIISVQKRNKNL